MSFEAVTLASRCVGQAGLRDACLEVAQLVRDAGGRALVIGGAVRDALVAREPTDIDIEVFGLSPARIAAALSQAYKISEVGRAFGVFKLHGTAIDVSFPRRRNTADAEWDADLAPEDAARRRDFTLNAMAFDPLTQEFIDPFGGARDLARHSLRHVSDHFGEDPLRVYRAMQLCGRYELAVAPETLALCRTLAPAGLPRERVFEEWRKLVERSTRPSLGLAFLRDCGWLRHTPELAALVGCEQDPVWHPEGEVWAHTLHCMDAFARARTHMPREDLIVGLAVLCHDLGKPATTRRESGRVTSIGHAETGVELTRQLLERWSAERGLVDEVTPLVASHLGPSQLYAGRAGDSAIRRLSRRVGRIDRLVRVARADHAGRPPLEAGEFPAGDWLLERAQALDVARAVPSAIVRGRHLIELGLEPGPHFGEILDACYEAQLDGRVHDLASGLALARTAVAEAGGQQLDDPG